MTRTFVEKMEPRPDNVDGLFYVEHGCCLTCDLPRTIAPSMFKYTEDQTQCYVYRQPETEEDMDKMVEVLEAQDILCIRCRSRDRGLLKRLRAEGLREICDK